MSASLPAAFRDLEPWVSWGFASEGERYARRARSTMEELNAFYTALKPRMEDLIQYLSAFPWGSELSEEDRRLYHLGMSYMEAAVPIDLGWKKPTAEDSFPVERLVLAERP